MNDNAAARGEIEKVLTALQESWNRHDVPAYAAMWQEDADFVNVLGMYLKGRAALQAELEFLHADFFRDSQVRLTRRQIRFLAPHIALVHVWWEMTGARGLPIRNPDGSRSGVFTHLMVSTPEGWRFAATQNTENAPMPGAPPR